MSGLKWVNSSIAGGSTRTTSPLSWNGRPCHSPLNVIGLPTRQSVSTVAPKNTWLAVSGSVRVAQIAAGSAAMATLLVAVRFPVMSSVCA